MNEKMIRKQIRRSINPASWSLVVYYIIMNVAVSVMTVVDMLVRMIGMAAGGDFSEAGMMDVALSAVSGGWGYIVTGCVGVIILLCWKGKDFWKHEIWAKGKPMRPGSFFAILAVFLGCQMAATIGSSILEMILNRFGLSAAASMESASANVDSFSMWLYMAVWAPVTEELLFRGLIQRMLLPHGKRFAIFGSAFLFGIFHGNLVQTPYAFLVGLVLGYVACEYSIAWAMLLHMINNMVLGDSLNRVMMGMPEGLMNMVFILLTGCCAVAGIIILALNRDKIRETVGPGKMDRRVLGCFFTNPGVIVLTVMMIFNMVLLLFLS